MRQKLDSVKSTIAAVVGIVAIGTTLVSWFQASTTTPLCGLSFSYSVPHGRGSIPLRLYEVVNPGPANLQDITLAFTIEHPFDTVTSSPKGTSLVSHPN